MVAVEVRSADRILKGALKLFAFKGYDATSVREICEAAGITKPTLYHFYGSKEGVYLALVEGALSEFRLKVGEELGRPGTTEERLKRVARAYFESASRRPDLTRFLFGLVHNPPSTAPHTDFPRFYEGVVADVARHVDDGVLRGELAPGPTDVRMLVFMGALGEALCGYMLTGRPDLAPGLADAIVESVFSGWNRKQEP